VGGVAGVFQPISQDLEAGGEPLVAVVNPDVFAEGDEGGEAVGGQGAEELVQLVSGGGVADALLVDRVGGAADGEPDGVVDQQEEGKPGLQVGEPGRLERLKERLGQGEGVGAEWVAGLEDPGYPGMGLEHLAEPVGQELELVGPVQGGVQVGVDLGQDVVEDQVVELLFVADVVVEGTGDDPQAGGQAAHAQGVGAVMGDDRQRLFDNAFTGKPVTAVLAVAGRAKPQRG
jgi:hypothetical protein